MITELQNEFVLMIYYLLQFVTNSLVYLTVTSFGAAVALFMDLYIRKRKNRSKTIILYAIIPAIIVACMKQYVISYLGEDFGNSILFGTAFLLGIIGEQLSKTITDMRNLIPVYNNIIKIVTAIRKGQEIKNLETVDTLSNEAKTPSESEKDSEDQDNEKKNTT